VKAGISAVFGRRRELGILKGAPSVCAAAMLAIGGAGAGLAAQAPAVEPVFRFSVDSVHREIIAELSPLYLPAHATHHDIAQLPPQAVVLPVTGWIEGYAGEIVDSAGRPVPSVVIHHLNLIVPERRELFSTIMQRLGAAGAETPPVRLPELFGHPLIGYPIHRGDSLLVTIMLNNPTDRTYRNARLRVRLPYAAQGVWPSPMSIVPFYLDVMPPAGKHEYDLPVGHSEKSWEGRPAVPGRILAVGGHLHEYGVALRLEDVTAGRVLWQAAPVTDAAGHVVAMPTKTFWWRGGVHIEPDHIYRATAVYDNPTGHMIPGGAMGALGGVFLPDHMQQWPAVDRGSPEYQRDVQVTYDTRMDDMDDMHGMQDRQRSTAAMTAATGASDRMHEQMVGADISTRRPAPTP